MCVCAQSGVHRDYVQLRACGKGREWERRSVPAGLHVYVRRGLAAEERET